MSWSPNATFAALLDDRQREEIFAVEISGYSTVFTNGPVTSSSWTYLEILGLMDAESGGVDVARGTWELGSLTFALEDRSGAALALASVSDLAGRTVTLWMGFRGLAQASWERIGTFTIERARIVDHGRYEFECIEPFPELGRALASSLGSGNRKSLSQTKWPDDTKVYVEDTDGLVAAQRVVIYDEKRVCFATIDSVGSDLDGTHIVPWVQLVAETGVYIVQGGTLAPVLALTGNPVNIAVRILVDDFALVGDIQTNFPLTAVEGAWATGDGFGVPLSRLDVTAIKAERDSRISTLAGQVIFDKSEENGRSWFDDLCHGVLQPIVRRNGLLSIRSALIPSATGGTPPTISNETAGDWEWERTWIDAANRVIVEGDMLGDRTTQLAVVENAGSIAAIGRRELRLVSPWLRTSMNGVSNAGIIGGRILARTSGGVEVLSCNARVSQSNVEPGDVALMTHPHLPDTGAGTALVGGVVELESAAFQPSENGLAVVARRYPAARAGGIAPDDIPDYGSATTLQKSLYAFISQDDGKMPDGSPGYTWV